jgi:hypothetical protein
LALAELAAQVGLQMAHHQQQEPQVEHLHLAVTLKLMAAAVAASVITTLVAVAPEVVGVVQQALEALLQLAKGLLVVILLVDILG